MLEDFQLILNETIVKTIVSFLFTVLFIPSSFAQETIVDLEYNVTDFEIKIEWVLAVHPIAHSGEILVLTDLSEGNSNNLFQQNSLYGWTILNSDGSIKCQNTSPKSNAFNWDTDVLLHSSHAAVVQTYKVFEDQCAVPTVGGGTLSPGVYDLLKRTELNFTDCSFIGDVLQDVAGLDSCLWNLIPIAQWVDDDDEYLAFRNDSILFKLGSGGIVDSLDFISFDGLTTTNNSTEPNQACGNVRCKYWFYDTLLVENELLLMRSMVTDSLFLGRDIIKMNYQGDVTAEYEHPYGFLDSIPASNFNQHYLREIFQRIHRYGNLWLYHGLHEGISPSNLEAEVRPKLFALFNDDFELVKEVYLNDNDFFLAHDEANDYFIIQELNMLAISHRMLDGSRALSIYNHELKYIGTRDIEFDSCDHFVNSVCKGVDSTLVVGVGCGVPGEFTTQSKVLIIGLSSFDNLLSTSILEPSEDGVRIFPNPNEGDLFISLPPGHVNETILMYDVNGILLYQSDSLWNQEMINLYGLSSGIYILCIGNSYCEKVIVK